MAESEENDDVHYQTFQLLKAHIEVLEREVMHLTHFKTQAKDKIQNIQDDKNSLNKVIHQLQRQIEVQKCKNWQHFARELLPRLMVWYHFF